MKGRLIKGGYLFLIMIFLLPFLALIVESMRLESWRYVYTDLRTYKAIATTVIIASLTLLLNILIGTPAASVLARKEFKGKKLVEGIILLPLIIPSFVTSMGIYFTFIKIGLAETLLGVVFTHTVITLPYYIRSTIVGYKTLGEGYELMGRIMGANALKRFYYVILPHIMPSIIAGSSLVIIVSFAQYLNTLIIGGGRIITVPILMFPYVSGGDVAVGSIYSISYIFINFILIFFLEKSVKGVYNRRMSGEKIW